MSVSRAATNTAPCGRTEINPKNAYIGTIKNVGFVRTNTNKRSCVNMTKKGLENVTDSIKFRFFEWSLDAEYLDPSEVADMMDVIDRE